MKTIAIVGSRTWGVGNKRPGGKGNALAAQQEYIFQRTMDKLTEKFGHYNLVTGDAAGADTMAFFCARYDDFTIHKADWEQYDKAAGPIRNQKIVDDADVWVGFFGSEFSRGTLDCYERATKKGLERWCITSQGILTIRIPNEPAQILRLEKEKPEAIYFDEAA